MLTETAARERLVDALADGSPHTLDDITEATRLRRRVVIDELRRLFADGLIERRWERPHYRYQLRRH
jgi:predicted transcriptional regulator